MRHAKDVLGKPQLLTIRHRGHSLDTVPEEYKSSFRGAIYAKVFQVLVGLGEHILAVFEAPKPNGDNLQVISHDAGFHRELPYLQ